jgi:hypothetical protein
MLVAVAMLGLGGYVLLEQASLAGHLMSLISQ